MKKQIGLILGVVLFAPAAMAQVYSANAVGYIKRTVEANTFALLQTPFVQIDGEAHTVEKLFTDTLPIGTTVFKWNDAGQTYEGIQQLAAGFWNPQNVEVERGQAMFILVPETADIVLVGEVPGTTTYATTDTPLVEGFNTVGNPYPTTMVIEDSGLEDAAAIGDVAFKWNQAQQTYEGIQKLAVGFWNPPGIELQPGDGVFLSHVVDDGAVWTETPEYSWPTN